MKVLILLLSILISGVASSGPIDLIFNTNFHCQNGTEGVIIYHAIGDLKYRGLLLNSPEFIGTMVNRDNKVDGGKLTLVYEMWGNRVKLVIKRDEK